MSCPLARSSGFVGLSGARVVVARFGHVHQAEKALRELQLFLAVGPEGSFAGTRRRLGKRLS
jgi:hypothetical protein